MPLQSTEIEVTPRRPLDDSNPGGYKESDKDFVLNNLEACVAFLEAKPKPRIEIFHYEIAHPQAFIPQGGGEPKVGGTPAEVSVRLADNHGIWEASTTIRDAIKQLLRSIKVDNRRFDEKRPIHIDDYEVVFADTVRCNAFHSDGREITPGTFRS